MQQSYSGHSEGLESSSGEGVAVGGGFGIIKCQTGLSGAAGIWPSSSDTVLFQMLLISVRPASHLSRQKIPRALGVFVTSTR